MKFLLIMHVNPAVLDALTPDEMEALGRGTAGSSTPSPNRAR